MALEVIQCKAEHERLLRRWLLKHDPVFAMHRQLKDYFLAPTASFGVLCRLAGEDIKSACFFSTYSDKSFMHQYIGDVEDIEIFRQHLVFPCQAFLRPDHAPHAESPWTKVLDVTPGFVIDHPAYDGVFSRIAPRFAGAVYEHP